MSGSLTGNASIIPTINQNTIKKIMTNEHLVQSIHPSILSSIFFHLSNCDLQLDKKKKAMLMDIELETVAAIIIKWLSESFKDFMFFISYWYCSLINPTCPFAILSFSPKCNVIIFLLLSQYLHAVTESNARLQHRKTKSFDGNMYECAYQI